MPYKSCAAAFCRNNTNKAKHSDPDIMFHGFPSENDLRAKWIQFCRRDENWVPNKSASICSQHFLRDDYQLGNIPLYNIPPNVRRLHLEAVPTIVICPTEHNGKNPRKRKDTRNEEDAQINESTRHTTHITDHNYQNLNACPSTETRIMGRNQNYPDEQEEKIKALKLELKKMKLVVRRNNTLKKHKKQLISNLEQLKIENKRLKNEIVSLKREKEKNEKPVPVSNRVVPAIKKMLQGTLSANQIDIILKRKKRVAWTEEEMRAALTLKYLSFSCYKFLANKLNYPLPSLSTLQRFAASLSFNQDVPEDEMEDYTIVEEAMVSDEIVGSVFLGLDEQNEEIDYVYSDSEII